MIFTKRIAEITYDDVAAFCNQRIEEGTNLDYKATVPERLENTVCAMANTYGGVIVIGVSEENGVPKLPVEGMPNQDGLAEQVTQIVMSNISPPIVPDVQVCTKDGKCFVVVRVQESDIGPHAIAGNTKVYFRTGNRNQPEDIADVNRVLWLGSRRQKANELRERLFHSIQKRATSAMTIENAKIEYGKAILLLSPLHPYQPFVEYSRMLDIGRASAGDWDGYKIPRDPYDARVVLNGIAYSKTDGRNIYSYAEYNQYGMVCNIEDFGWDRKDENDKSKPADHQIILHHIVRSVDVFLESCGKFLTQLGFWGVVNFAFQLDDIALKNFAPIGQYSYRPPTTQPILDPDIKFERSISAKVLAAADTRANFTLEFCTEVAWAFGYHTEGGHIEKYLRDAKRFNG